MNSVTTDYVLHLNAGLTQVLDDGATIYLYDTRRISEPQTGGFAYYLGDDIGYDSEKAVTVTLQNRFQISGHSEDSYLS